MRFFSKKIRWRLLKTWHYLRHLRRRSSWSKRFFRQPELPKFISSIKKLYLANRGWTGVPDFPEFHEIPCRGNLHNSVRKRTIFLKNLNNDKIFWNTINVNSNVVWAYWLWVAFYLGVYFLKHETSGHESGMRIWLRQNWWSRKTLRGVQ